jgi:protein-S-isoprenylcysteine O-methyltransferase Ste14
MKPLHYLLVAIQFIGIFYFIFTGSVFPENIYVLIIEAIATLIGVWAVLAMKLHTVTVLPSVKKGGQLCTTGPYRVIRHPMYTAVLLLLSGLLLNNYSHTGLVVFFIVLVDLIVKMNVEEKILLAHYTDYKNYMTKTKRIIPFLY